MLGGLRFLGLTEAALSRSTAPVVDSTVTISRCPLLGGLGRGRDVAVLGGRYRAVQTWRHLPRWRGALG